MKNLLPVFAAALLLVFAGQGRAAMPTEREVQTVRAVQVYQPAGQSARRPIGAIDFSASGSSARRLGPWDLETDAFRDGNGVIFYDDGGASQRGQMRQYQRNGESRCTTLGNVTVCK